MKYTAIELEGNVNVSERSALKEFFYLTGGIFAIIILFYLLLGFAVDLIVPRLSIETEEMIGEFFSAKVAENMELSTDPELQALLDDLSKGLLYKEGYFRASIAPAPDVNAIALPGRDIIVFSELLKEVETENELAFVLSHELGHYVHRDHLRGLGRGLVLIAISITVLGSESSATDFLFNSLSTVEMQFSQQQESAADLWALENLNKKYGHVAGATDFFEKMGRKNEFPEFLTFFSSHPGSENRIKYLNQIINEKKYVLKDKTPLKKINTEDIYKN